MAAPLNAASTQAGALFSNSNFEIPQYQREYSWQDEEIGEFWSDLRSSLSSLDYFLGLIILTEEDGVRHVVDGQQRLVTLTLLATALYYAARELGRKALADHINATFLHSIDYDTDEATPRVVLSDLGDNQTLRTIIETGKTPPVDDDGLSVSSRIVQSYSFLRDQLVADLRSDPFKRLGRWADFITNQIYFAVFIHPDPASAYQVFEVVNTRGRELTTADLLKNYILSQTPRQDRENLYNVWQSVAGRFPPEGAANTFAQYLRHVIIMRSGHVLAKDLFDFLANRRTFAGKAPPSPIEIVSHIVNELPLYLQIIDPTSSGPVEGKALEIFSAFNRLGVITVRPIVLALARSDDFVSGLEQLLKLVVRRIVVGNLGTGNVERRFGDVARDIYETRSWQPIARNLSDLNPSAEEFKERLSRRSYNKNTLAFIRRSIVQSSISPSNRGTLHFIWPKNNADWESFSEEDGYWYSTIGNTYLSEAERRPVSATESWDGFRHTLLMSPVPGEWTAQLQELPQFEPSTVETLSSQLADKATRIWY